jgi:hypothetical protein
LEVSFAPIQKRIKYIEAEGSLPGRKVEDVGARKVGPGRHRIVATSGGEI